MAMGSRLRSLLRRGRTPDRRAPLDEVDWQRIDDYSTLYRTIPQARFPDQQSFVKGPLERYLQLVGAASGRGAARIMEHLRASVRWFRDSEAAKGRPTGRLEAMVEEAVRARFASGSDDVRYMIDVFEGRATHNYRASDDPDD